MPCFLFWLWPPIVRDTPEGPATAAARLQEMGPLSTDEKVMMGAVTLAVVLWVSRLVWQAQYVTGLFRNFAQHSVHSGMHVADRENVVQLTCSKRNHSILAASILKICLLRPCQLAACLDPLNST
jgi:hypothetical protein